MSIRRVDPVGNTTPRVSDDTEEMTYVTVISEFVRMTKSEVIAY